MGIDDVHFAVDASPKSLGTVLRHGEAFAYPHFGDIGVELSVAGDSMGTEIIQRLSTNGQHRGAFPVHLLQAQFDHIVVITAGQTAVAGDHHEQNGAVLPFAHIGRRPVPSGPRDLVDRPIKNLEVGSGAHRLILGLAQLGGSNHFHSPGDLLCALHTLDTGFDIF